MDALRFAKMSGAGNDFIVIDNRRTPAPAVTAEEIRRLCARRHAVGADGLMLLEDSAAADFAMRYFNADGSAAAMCGNGGRCIARFAVLLGLVPEAQEMEFATPAGAYRARVEGKQVQLQLPPPAAWRQDIRFELPAGERSADYMETGVPHVVLFTPDADAEDVSGLGRAIRFHARLQPAGANVNFCQVLDEHRLRLRTYERGVEGETLACGTGAAAAALLAARRDLVRPPVSVQTRGGEWLELSFQLRNGEFHEIRQRGEARLIYWGELAPEALDFTLPEPGNR